MRRRRITPRLGRIQLLAAGIAALLALADVAGGSTGLLYLAPAILLGALLAGGLYPGERVLARPLARVRTVRRRLVARVARPRPAQRIHPRGGRLLGARLAGRAPPGRAVSPIS